MKKILTILFIGVFIISGCANAATPADAQSDTPSSEPEKSAQTDQGRRARPDGVLKRDANEVLGRITVITSSEITSEVGPVSRPENSREAPAVGDNSRPEGQPRQERPDDASRPDGAAPIPDRQRDGSASPEGRFPGGRGGFGGGSMELEYTGEEASYALTDSVTITKGIRDDEKLTVSDLAKGDIVRLVLDEAEQLVSIWVFDANQ